MCLAFKKGLSRSLQERSLDGGLFSIIDGTNCSSKAVLVRRLVNLVFISFSV
jgi:hypothetical protein